MISLKYLFEAKNDHWYRKNIKKGQKVSIVLKQDQGTNRRVIGKVDRILTKKTRHPRGIKVMLTDGQVGRVQKILEK